MKRVGGRPDLKFNETAKLMPKKKVPLAVSKKIAVARMKHMNLKHMKLSKVPLAVSKKMAVDTIELAKVPLAVSKKMAVASMKATKAAVAAREAEARQAALEAQWRTHGVWVSQAACSESSSSSTNGPLHNRTALHARRVCL